MLKKPVKASKNAILEGIRVQRKSKGKVKLVIIGLKREGVQPTALILDHKLITQKQWYDPKEYDVISVVEDYDGYLEIYKLKTQGDVVEFLYRLAKNWEKTYVKEYLSFLNKPIETLIAKNEIVELTLHKFGKGFQELPIHDEHFKANTLKSEDIVNKIKTYKPLLSQYRETEEWGYEHWVMFKYILNHPRSTPEGLEYTHIFCVLLPVNTGTGNVDYTKLEFNWLLPKGFEGLTEEHLKQDPTYLEIIKLKGGDN